MVCFGVLVEGFGVLVADLGVFVEDFGGLGVPWDKTGAPTVSVWGSWSFGVPIALWGCPMEVWGFSYGVLGRLWREWGSNGGLGALRVVF